MKAPIIAGVPTFVETCSPQALALGLMLVSGFSGLAYEIVWTQQSAVWLGHEAAAVLAVITAFFGGLGLGALLLGPRIERSVNPVRWYAGCEIAIASWSLTLTLVSEPASRWLLDLTGVQPSATWQWSVVFCGTFVLLLPATAGMGATLPAMERCISRLSRERSSIAALYAANTCGAVLGVLAVAFWLVPEWGLARTTMICAALNLVCAFVALRLFRGAVPSASARPAMSDRRVLLLLAATGLLGIGYEVLVVRVLSQVAENTVYTFALLLAVYLIGTALGAAAYHRSLENATSRPLTRGRLLVALALACLLCSAALAGAATIKRSIVNALGAGVVPALGAEAALAVLGFLVPSFLMGALFSAVATDARRSGMSFARTLGTNTLGAALAPIVAGVVLVPAVGAKSALLLVAFGYVVLSVQESSSLRAVAAVAAGIVALAIWGPSLDFSDVPAGGRMVSHQEGVLGAVSVIEDAEGVRTLRINNRDQEGSSATPYADARQALLPLLLHTSPRRVLFLGLGTGVTASAAAGDPALEIDAVELVPEVIEASKHFRRTSENDDERRLHLIAADARRYVRTTHERYDVIVSDNFHPARSGSGALYTLEHFDAVRQRLAPDGIFCQWLPLHQLDLETLRSIVRTFTTVYPRSWALLATNSLDTPVVGLLARRDGERFAIQRLRGRLTRATALNPAEFGIADDLALLGSFVGGPESLKRFGAGAPLNTDDRPVVTYRAPRITYARDSLPRDRLIALVHELDIRPRELVALRDDEASWAARLQAYATARNRYLEIGRDIRPSTDVRQMLLQAREPLLAVLHISPDFRPAYDPLLRMAKAVAEADASAARALLTELESVQPARPDAVEAFEAFSHAR